jgi:hypothetical protein
VAGRAHPEAEKFQKEKFWPAAGMFAALIAQ